MDQGEQHRAGHQVRIAPIPQAEWTAAAREAIAVLPPEMAPAPDATINVLGVLAHHPDLARAVLDMSLYLRFRSTLSDRRRELLILRTAWLRGGRYELLRHARLARRFGFADEELAAITVGSGDPIWPEAEAVLLRATEELCRDHRVGDATWVALSGICSVAECMDVLFCVGAYDMLAMAWNTIGVEPEPGLAPYPAEDVQPSASPGVFLVLSRPSADTPEGVEAYHRWYDEHHVPESLHLPGFVRARRFRLADEQLVPGRAADPGFAYAALYEIDDIAAIPAARERMPDLAAIFPHFFSPAIDSATMRAFVLEQIAVIDEANPLPAGLEPGADANPCA